MDPKKSHNTWEKRKGEIIGILWIMAALMMLASLVTYHPGDPSWNTASSNQELKNQVGWIGALVSDLLLTLLGAGAYLFPIMAFLLGWGKIRNPVSLSFARWAGFLGLVITVPVTLQLAFDRIPLSFNELIPAGGILGSLLSQGLLQCCAPLGSILMMTTGLLLSTILFTGASPVLWVLGAVRFLRNRGTRGDEPLSESADPQGGSQGAVKTLSETVQAGSPPETAQRPSGKPHIVDKPASPRIPPLQEEFQFVTTLNPGHYRLPSLNLLEDPPKTVRRANRDEILMNSQILEKKLRDFGVQGEVVQVHPGPVITMYEFQPAPTIKLNQIVNLSDDLALAMKSGSVRIVAPIPEKSTVGIEVPNRIREEVRLKEILASEPFNSSRSPLTLALGRDIFGAPITSDLMRMPHLLVAGATGSGKSVALNAMICSLLFRCAPSDVRMLMIDPKMIELSVYEGIPHLISPVVTQAKEAAWALQKVISEMQRRYQVLSEKGCRNVEGYHKTLAEAHKKGEEPGTSDTLPYLVVIIDELADLMMVAGREVEDAITRLAQMARAAGIHLIVATQRPSVDVITGIIKANFPTRISFQVSSKTDSRTILDANGAEELLGKGDMLFLPPGSGQMNRIHGAYISDNEIKEVVENIRNQSSPAYDPAFEAPRPESVTSADAVEDACYGQARDLVLGTGQASISLIQRRLRIGFNRAARLIERMEDEGLVGPSHAGKREVFKKKVMDL